MRKRNENSNLEFHLLELGKEKAFSPLFVLQKKIVRSNLEHHGALLPNRRSRRSNRFKKTVWV